MEGSSGNLATRVRTPLSASHIAHLRTIGKVVRFKAGETLVSFGEPDRAFFYILEGEVAAWDEVMGLRDANATLGPSQFSGEMSFLSGGAAQLSNRAVSSVTAIRVPRVTMMQALADIPEMGEIVVTVFVARRLRLIERGRGDLTLIEPEKDRALKRVETFSVPNPYRAYSQGSAKTLVQQCIVSANQSTVKLGECMVLAEPMPSSVALGMGLEMAVEQGAELDAVIAGAGLALAAAVYEIAEGLNALLVDETTVSKPPHRRESKGTLASLPWSRTPMYADKVRSSR